MRNSCSCLRCRGLRTGPDRVRADRRDVPVRATWRHSPSAIKSVLSFDPEQTRRHLAAKMALYSPARAAGAIVDAATTLAADGQLQ